MYDWRDYRLYNHATIHIIVKTLKSLNVITRITRYSVFSDQIERIYIENWIYWNRVRWCGATSLRSNIIKSTIFRLKKNELQTETNVDSSLLSNFKALIDRGSIRYMFPVLFSSHSLTSSVYDRTFHGFIIETTRSHIGEQLFKIQSIEWKLTITVLYTSQFESSTLNRNHSLENHL